MLFSGRHGVIVACDVPSLDELQKLVLKTHDIDGIAGYKLGFTLALRHGLAPAAAVIRMETDLPVIFDYQKAGTDIPQMGEPFAALMKEARMDAAIIFPQAGPKTQEAFTRALLKERIVPMVGGEMSHPSFLAQDGGYIRNDAPEAIYALALSHGVEHLIVPGTKPDAIRSYASLSPTVQLSFPGIGRQGGDLERAFEACEGHRAYAIIGSAIYGSLDIKKSAEQFAEQALAFG